tara:strand:- start:371 stop:703 length:333 start_codon:yes stop_codon:yes gene_type:complete
MKLSIDDIDGKVVKSNDTYNVIDNTALNELVVSKTVLHPNKQTTGHTHPGQEEVYYFIHGHGEMELDDKGFPVRAGDVVLIHDGIFHKVFNDSSVEDLVFLCVFNGKRSH